MPYGFKFNPITGRVDMVTDPTEMIPHVALLDMPDLTGGNTNHDSRYALQGTFAAMPAFGVAGRRYWATDVEILYWDNGAAWVEMLRGENVTRLAQLAERDHTSLTNVLPNQHHAQQHDIIDPADHVSGATPGQMLQADGNGLPVDGSLSDIQILAIAAAAHAQQHAITAIADHTSAATPEQILKADANGLPVDATNTDADVADAVTKKHSQNTDIRLQDADSDTKIQVEEAPDEDKIRFDTGGAERMVMDASGLNFETLKAIAMVCDNGATLPTVPAPVKGQWFLHTPVGRDILMQYNGASWTPIISLGAVTMYVDVTGATHGDNQNYGYSNVVTFDMVQFAIDQIPPLYAGNVTIYIDNAIATASPKNIYAENVTIQGKMPTGNYSISIYGALTYLQNGTADTNNGTTVLNVVGTGSIYGILMDIGQFGTSRESKILMAATGAAGANEYKVIDRQCLKLAFNSGGVSVPTAGKIVKGNTSLARGIIVCYQDDAGVIGAVQSGSFAGGDADANLIVVSQDGTFSNGETLSMYTNSDNLTADTADLCTLNAAQAIDSSRLAIVAAFSSTPSNKAYTVYNWGTRIRKLTLAEAQTAVNTFNLYIYTDGSFAAYLYARSSLNATRCCFYAASGFYAIYAGGFVAFKTNDCFIHFAAVGAYVIWSDSAQLKMYGTKISSVYATCIQATAVSTLILGSSVSRCILECTTSGAGVVSSGNSYCNLYSAPQLNLIRACTIGMQDIRGGTAAYPLPGSSVIYCRNTEDTQLEVGGDENYLKLAERAAAPASAAGYGYLYIGNTAPSELWFEDDTGGTEQISTSLMLFIWGKITRQYLRYYRIREISDFNEEAGQLLIFGGNRVEDLSKIEYSVYPKQHFHPLYEDVQVGTTEGEPIYEKRIAWQTIDSLNLTPMSAPELPHSMHIAALKAVDIPNKKAMVVRKWMGQNYEVPNCYVSLGTLEAYQAGKIKVFNPAYPITAAQNADCFVLVYFISENPYDTAIEIPVIVDKIVK